MTAIGCKPTKQSYYFAGETDKTDPRVRSLSAESSHSRIITLGGEFQSIPTIFQFAIIIIIY